MGLLNGHIHGETRQAKSRKAIIRMLAAVVIAFFVCWAPFHVQRVFYIYGSDLPKFHIINEHLYNVAGALYYVSATVNPILYNVMSGRYRIAFQQTLLCRRAGHNCEHTICREATPVSSTIRNRESRISFVSKVDFVKDPAPFCMGEDRDSGVFKTYSIT